jgi:hypothetical protein
MQNPFDQFDAPQARPMGAPPVIQGPPKALDQAEQQRLGLSVNADQRAERSQAVTEGNQRFDNIAKLRTEFAGREAVKNYATALPMVSDAMRIAKSPNATGADDLSLIYTFGKVMDPGSVVREGELALASSTGSFAQNLEGAIERLRNGDRLPPEVRMNLVNAMRRRGVELAANYNRERDSFTGISERYQFNPLDVVGEHPGGAFQQSEAEFLGRPVRNRDGSQGAAPAAMQRNGGGLTDPREMMGVREAIENELGQGSGGLSVPVKAWTPQQQAIFDALPIEQQRAWSRGELYIKELDDEGAAQQKMDAERDTLWGATDAAVRGTADTLTFGFADELAALGNTVLNPDSTFADNLSRERAIDDTDARVNSYSRMGGQIVGGVALPVGLGARTPGQLARVGAGVGSGYGFGSGEGLADRAIGAAKGAGAGALGGYAFGKAVPAVGNALGRFMRPSESQAERNALLQAAQRSEMDLMPADVGGPLVRRITAAGAQAPLSAGPIINQGQKIVQQGAAQRDRIAARVGRAGDVEGAGETAKAGADKFRSLTSARANRLYQRAEKMSKGARIQAVKTVEALDRHIAELSGVPGMDGSAELTALTKLREQINAGNFNVSGVRGMRSALRQKFLTEGLRGSDFQRRVSEIVDAAGEDITENLAEQGLEGASQAFAAADGFYRTRVQTIDKVLAPIIGKDGGKSGEQVMAALESSAKQNGRRLQQFMAALPSEERAAVQATIISRLGVAKPGSQNADGSAFSLESFLTSWNSMTPRAKAALFPNDARAALDDLAKVAAGSREAGKYANRSNTGGAVWGNVGVWGAGATLIGPIKAGLAALGQYGAGKLLASPAIARLMAHPPRDAKVMSAKLSAIAAKNPALSAEIQSLMRAVNDNGARVAERSVAASETDKQNRP